ncbi:manganese-dependent inorganic pyrophosphatase [Patescibacteria group bacterium]|nr:manganese-dependent inorganic pyrophosphatase [Candidatus Falkowbacteria bacterium]MBU3906177.1 manganese-dependent inorganic pyrophosphatase [Patescibacteria group bacterium]MBU4015116.1 manganese-dependent inorganic pyrophosphatase [Patescibacteria group bacterium]MBU4027032.1 manganese-dependent inorganic pyrophosphatase [Patescibacteria group bacterium]MBU4073241.1 manganese-dependent inorganic pyrophosphatase [Patescibacteria group bacterium]
MLNKIYIIGHKSPDLDSVAAAISYANFKNRRSPLPRDCGEAEMQSGGEEYLPASAGAMNKETVFALEKFGFEAPEILKNADGKKVILVDHNEFAQAADGVENAEIIEVLDHHKVDFKYSEPIVFDVRPWGASCSIIAEKYFKNNLELNKNLAGLMLAAILVDTVITKSPTCTENDKIIIEKLAGIADIKHWQEFGMEIFKIRSSASELSDAEIIKSDFKDFNFKQGKFGIGQVETVDLNNFADRKNGLMDELNKLKNSENYHSVILFITDIIKEGSEFLVATNDQEKVEQALGVKLDNNKVYIKGVISRKKQVAPKFAGVFDE